MVGMKGSAAAGLCPGRFWFAELPVNLQNRIGIHAFSEWSRMVFVKVAIEMVFGGMR